MKIYRLLDIDSGDLDAIIVATETTKEEIKQIIDEVKADVDNDECEINRIKAKLPKDCTMYETWKDKENVLYY